jgi:hypothetical protein
LRATTTGAESLGLLHVSPLFVLIWIPVAEAAAIVVPVASTAYVIPGFDVTFDHVAALSEDRKRPSTAARKSVPAGEEGAARLLKLSPVSPTAVAVQVFPPIVER